MNRLLWPLLAIATLITAAPAAAQSCNHCGYASECDPFDHWDNCGTGGPGWDFVGGCAAGCDNLSCVGAHGSSGGCGAPSQEDFAQAVALAREAGDWQNLTVAVLTGKIEYDRVRSVLYLQSCSGRLSAQVPLSWEASQLLAASIEQLRSDLLDALDQLGSSN